jgi:succinyl-diaminopimelate desuccinylase
MTTDAVELARELIRFDTINPPGQEKACAEHLGRKLEAAGFRCDYIEMGEGRANLVARIGGAPERSPLAFTGHIDVVPLGARAWSVAPFGGETGDGKVFGRGASDMKSGVAAFVAAAIDIAPRLGTGPGVVLVITAGEETGCEGAFHVARTAHGLLGTAGALVVAEPTSNRPLVGHRGALWLKAATKGVTAHASMPDRGVNAVYKAARAISKLEDFDFNVARHPVLGSPTLNVGWVRGGMNINSVPDLAEVGIDIRTIPAQTHNKVKKQLAAYLGEEVELSALLDVEGVWTEPGHPWMQAVFETVREVTGAAPEVEAAPFFTDASALAPALGGVPTVILGPGPTHMAHQTDEYCEIARIEVAVEINRRLIAGWCGL